MDGSAPHIQIFLGGGWLRARSAGRRPKSRDPLGISVAAAAKPTKASEARRFQDGRAEFLREEAQRSMVASAYSRACRRAACRLALVFPMLVLGP